MTPRDERVDTFREKLRQLVEEGGDENFVVFEEARTQRFLQCASRRGEPVVLMDVPTAPQGLGDDARSQLEALGFEAEPGVSYKVNQDAVKEALPEVQQRLHEWIAAGMDPEDPHVPELVARRVIDEEEGGEQASHQAVVDPDRGALLADRVFREVLGAPDDYDVFVELNLG